MSEDSRLAFRAKWSGRITQRDCFLIAAAAFAIIWIIHRALVQSITLDEANTFLYWVYPDHPTHWQAHSNNHVLNSILMRLSIWLFGLSHLTMRAPAILGGILYIVSICCLCRLLTDKPIPCVALFVCFVYNPFVMDYLVAARGYGLAIGFFALSLYLLTSLLDQIRTGNKLNLLRLGMAISASTSLSFTANFSWGYANGFLLTAAWIWILFGQRHLGVKAALRLTLMLSIPAALILLVFAGSTLTTFNRDQLFWGTTSLLKTWEEIRLACFSNLNPYLVNPLLAKMLKSIEYVIVPSVVLLTIIYASMLMLGRDRSREFGSWSRMAIAGTLGAILTLTLLAHWLQYQFFAIPLPFERTSLFLVPLLTAAIGAGLTATPFSRLQRFLQSAITLLLCIIGIYYLGTLRDSYFREWSICAELKSVYSVIEEEGRRTGVREVISDLNYTPSLNFYRILFRNKDLDEIPLLEKIPPRKQIYVLSESKEADFIRTEGLKPIFHGSLSDVVVLVKSIPTLPSISTQAQTPLSLSK